MAPDGAPAVRPGFSTLQCGSWIDARDVHKVVNRRPAVSVPFNAGRGLMPCSWLLALDRRRVSVPFNAGRGLMRSVANGAPSSLRVSVPFNAGRGLMRRYRHAVRKGERRFSTLQCGSWIDAQTQASRPLGLSAFQYPSMRVVD